MIASSSRYLEPDGNTSAAVGLTDRAHRHGASMRAGGFDDG